MPLISLRYHFRQALNVPARAAYDWATDFDPADGRLFSRKTRRTVHRLTDDAVVLTDVTYPDGRPRRIRRLVRMDPAGMAWTNTHLDGPFRHSQFWYRIVPDGRSASHLEFEGFTLEEVPRRLSSAMVAARAAQNRRHDSAEWRDYLAPALEAEVRAVRTR
jgi:hypothetical protein